MFMTFLKQQRENERFDLTWTNNMLFLSKWTNDPRLDTSVGHGSGFEQATCIYGDHKDELLKSSASHHLLIPSRFGGLQLVVQSEVDAYHCGYHRPGASNVDHTLPETLSAMTIDDVAQHQPRSRAVSGTSFDLRSNLSILPSVFTDTSPESYCDRTRKPASVFLPPSPCCPPPANNPETPGPDDLSPSVNFNEDSVSSPTLHILHLGREIPAFCLVKVKTHKLNNQPLFNAEAQLYFFQLGKLHVAKNSNGTFLPSTPIISMTTMATSTT